MSTTPPDIVKELRDEAQMQREVIHDHWQTDPDVMDRAADEIERLREQMKHLRK